MIFSNFEEYKELRKNIYYEANKNGLLSGISNISSFLSSIFGSFSQSEKLSGVSNSLGWAGYGLSVFSTLTNKALPTSGKAQMIYIDTATALASFIAVSTVVTGGAGFIPVVLTIGVSTTASVLIHNYFEKEAYNSHFNLGW